MNVTRQRSKYSSRVVKFASQVLFSMWQHQELRDVYRKAGWKEADFVTKTVAARNARPHSPTHLNSTLNRPMASQGGTRYEDRTMGRGASAGHNNHNQGNHSGHNYSVSNKLQLVTRSQHYNGTVVMLLLVSDTIVTCKKTLDSVLSEQLLTDSLLAG